MRHLVLGSYDEGLCGSLLVDAGAMMCYGMGHADVLITGVAVSF